MIASQGTVGALTAIELWHYQNVGKEKRTHLLVTSVQVLDTAEGP